MSGEWRCRLFDRFGVRKAEGNWHFEGEWVLNDYGEGRFEIGKNDPHFSYENLRFGNFFLFEHSTAGAWGGVLLGKRGWRRDKLVVGVKGIPFQFMRRVGPKVAKWQGRAGAMIKTALAWGNQQSDMLIEEGNIFIGGDPHEETPHRAKLLKSIRNIQVASGQDWNITPGEVETGNGVRNLVFYLNWYERLGIDLSDSFSLTEGINLEWGDDDMLTEDPDIVNDSFVTGSGATADVQTEKEYKNQDSIDEYGLTQNASTYNSTTPGVLLNKARAEVTAKAYPLRTYKPNVLDVGDAWVRSREGNIVMLNLSQTGFVEESAIEITGDATLGSQAKVRIRRRTINTKAQSMSLTVDEVRK